MYKRMLPKTKRKVQKVIIEIARVVVCASLLINCKDAIVSVSAYSNPVETKPLVVSSEPIRLEGTVTEDINASVSVTAIETNETEEDTEVVSTFTNETKETIEYLEGYETPQYIRCTGYCDYGYTKSGEYVREGVVAGRKEWLGKICYVYAVAEDGTCGDLIGRYEFLDTGYGINGSLVNGTSIDIWHPSENEVWAFAREYGDYVYIQIANE